MSSDEIPLKNKKNEPEFKLFINPAGRIIFRSDRIKQEKCRVNVRITNTLDKRQCFKVKTTSNVFFRVRPPYGFIEPNDTIPITFCFKCSYVPDPIKQLFVIYHQSTEETTDPQAVWSKSKLPDGVRRMAVQFEKFDGMPWISTFPMVK